MDKERAGIQSVEVGFGLLEVLTRASGPLMLKDLAAAAGMSAAKAHRYLVSYQRLNLVVQDARTARYDLGPSALRLGLAALSRVDAIRLARERVPALVEQLGATVALAVWGNRGPTIVHWEEAPLAATANLRLGDVMPLLSSATGRCFAAFLPAQKTGDMIAQELKLIQRLPAHSPADMPRTTQEVQSVLDQVRAQQCARVIDALLPGIGAFCAPVRDVGGHLVLGITTLGPHARFNSDWDGPVARTLRTAAAQLTRDLGGA